jgi:hypothetical protein
MDLNDIINKLDFEKKYIELDFNRGLSNEKCREIEKVVCKQRNEGFSRIHFTFSGLMARNDRVPDTFESILLKLETKSENKPILLKEILEDILEITDSFNIRSYNCDKSIERRSNLITIDRNLLGKNMKRK